MEGSSHHSGIGYSTEELPSHCLVGFRYCRYWGKRVLVALFFSLNVRNEMVIPSLRMAGTPRSVKPLFCSRKSTSVILFDYDYDL